MTPASILMGSYILGLLLFAAAVVVGFPTRRKRR